jgi:hypothetical protein
MTILGRDDYSPQDAIDIEIQEVHDGNDVYDNTNGQSSSGAGHRGLSPKS